MHTRNVLRLFGIESVVAYLYCDETLCEPADTYVVMHTYVDLGRSAKTRAVFRRAHGVGDSAALLA